MASSVSSNGGSNNVMIRTKSDSIAVVGGGHTTAMDERNTQTVGGATAMMGGLAPERRAADDSAISFSEEEEDEEDEMDGEDDDEEEDDNGPESSAAAAAFNAAAAFQRQLLANFPLFHHASDGSTKLDSDPSHSSAAIESPNPFETYMAAAAAAANAEALFRQHQQHMTTTMSGSARLSEKRTAHDSGTDDNDVSIGGGKASADGKSPAGIHLQQPSNKRRKQSKPVRISSDQEPGSNDQSSAVTAFLAAQSAVAAAALFNQTHPASSEEEEEGVLQTVHSSKRINGQQQMLEWVRATNHMAGSNESEQEEGQIIRSCSDNSSGGMLDHQLASRLLMSGNSSSSAARSFAEFLASTSAGSAYSKGFPLFPPTAYGGSWNQQQQQQMMMNIMSMNRSGLMLDDGEVSRSSSCASPTAGLGGHLTDGKRNENEESGPTSDSPFAFRNMAKYASPSGGFFPPGGPSVSSPFLFPFLQSSSAGNSPLANHSMARGGGLVTSPSVMGGSIRIFNHEAYCELCNKEFCNKYFLKTHKANKHGIYVDNIPPTTTTTGGGTTSVASDGRISAAISSSSSNNVLQSLPFSVSTSFAPLSVGAMTYPMHPPCSELDPAQSAITTISPSKNVYPSSGFGSASTAPTLSTSATTTVPSLSAITTSGSMNPPGGLMDFFPMWTSQTTTPPVTTVNNTTTTPCPTSSMKQQLQHLPGGIVNPEAYCELCQKEFCNKYFLKRHKAKMHGIVPPEGSIPTAAPTSAVISLPSSSGGSHKRSKSHPAKQTAPPTTAAVDLIKIPIILTAPAGAVQSPDRILPSIVNEAELHPPPVVDPVQETVTSRANFNRLVQGLGSVMTNETGGALLPSASRTAKFDVSNNSGSGANRPDNNSLSLLKIPTPSLSAMFSTAPVTVTEPVRIHHSKTPSSSSSASGGGGMMPQQWFSPERLRQMGVINTEAFCEICCKEFCNKYFLRTHKFKKHGIGSMPEQSHQTESSSSSTGMVRQHHYTNNNNNNSSKTAAGKASSETSSPEQKTPLNLVSTPPATMATMTTTTTTTIMGQDQEQVDGGMSCDLCQRPFQSAYLLHMHRTYFHNEAPPADESMNDTSAMEEEDNLSNEEDNSPRPPSIAVKSEPEMRNADEENQLPANNSSSVTISADLQKLQSMIMELNGSSSAAAAAAASMAGGEDRRRCWMDSPVKNNESSNHYMSASGGGIVKVVNASTNDPSVDAANLSSVCHLCGNKDFLNPSFLQMHMQNYHGIGQNGDPSAAAMEAAVAAAASQLGLDRLLDFGPPPTPSSTSGHGMKRSGGGGGGGGGGGRSSSSSASPAATRSYCQICNKELCNKYFMKTHMLKMHGIHLEASGGASQIGGVQCDICHKELCSKYFLKVHKQNTHGIVMPDHELLMPANMLKEHQGVMDLSFHQHQHHMMEGSSSPVKSTPAVTEPCPLCPKRFKSSKALKAHLSHDHSGSSGSTPSACTCYICSQQFNDVVALQVHLIKSHASHLMDHQQSPPPQSAATVTPTAGSSEQANQGVMSPPSPKTCSPSSLQRSSYCDYSAGYLFANEQRSGQMDACPPMPGLVPVSASPRPSVASPPASTANHQKIQCPLCGHQLALEQFQSHLMAHQLPVNFLHTLMPPTSDATAHLGATNQQPERSNPTAGHRKRRYRCSVCSRKFATRQLCLTHILQRHPPSMRKSNAPSSVMSKSAGFGPTSPVCHQSQRPLTCPRCGYATRQPQLLRLHLRTQQCIPVVARNPDLQQLPPYLAVPTSAGGGNPSRLSAINSKQALGLQSVQGQHAHRQDFVLQAFLLTQPDAENSKSSTSSNAKNRRDPGANQENGHHNNRDDPSAAIRRENKQNGNRSSQDCQEERKRPTEKDRSADSATTKEHEDEEEGQSCNFIPSLILLPVNRRIANPLSLTFSLTPA